MRRFVLDTGIAADYINRRRGIDQRAREAVRQGPRLGIGLPVRAAALTASLPLQQFTKLCRLFLGQAGHKFRRQRL